MSPLAAGLVLAALLWSSAPSWADRFTLETYYPSPAGVYTNLTVTSQTVVARDGGSNLVVGDPAGPAAPRKLVVAGGSTASWAEYFGYRLGAGQTGFAAPPVPTGQVPPPGRFFYNYDTDQFYYSSKNAVSTDPATWYRTISGFENLLVLSGLMPAKALTSSLAWVGPWTSANPGGVACGSSVCVRSPRQANGALYVLEVNGQYCITASLGQPVIKIYYRRWVPGNASGWVLVSTEASDLNDVPNSCVDFSTESMFVGPANWHFDVAVKAKRSGVGDTIQNLRASLRRVVGF